ncbi:MAG: sterol desaturase family protein [Pseudomonadota bacterium]
MQIVYNFLAFLGAFAAMEFVAWSVHKYIMHGVLWSLHRDHHELKKHRFERNDLFAVFFSFFASGLFIFGMSEPIFFWIGLGVSAYGAVYFIFHDMIVHRRLRLPFRLQSAYLRRITRAHRLHHAVREKHGAVSFGFLVSAHPDELKATLRQSPRL